MGAPRGSRVSVYPAWTQDLSSGWWNEIEVSCESGAPQTKAVRDHADRAECHGRAREDRAEQKSRRGKEHPRGDRDSNDVVDERPEQVLTHRAHRAARELDRRRDAGEIATQKRDVARVDRDIGSPADGDADIGPSERRGVID